MTIEIFGGNPGSGKSYCTILRLFQHVAGGGIAAVNFILSPDWAMTMARLAHRRARTDDEFCRKWARIYWKRVFYVGDSDTVMQLSAAIKKHDFVNRFCSPKVAKQREGAGLLIVDEAQLYFNSREWRKNMGFIEFFTQHRKLRWDALVVAHSIDMIDKQIQPLIEYETNFRNIQKVKFALLPRFPVPLFLSTSKYAGMGPGKGKKAGSSEWTFLKTDVANLYDSMDVFGLSGLSGRIARQPCADLWRKVKKQNKSSVIGCDVPYHLTIDPLYC